MAVLLPSPFFLHSGKSTWNLKNQACAKENHLNQTSIIAFHVVPFLPQSWKWKMGPSNISFLSFRLIFHFHDYGRKGNHPGKKNTSPVKKKQFPSWKVLREGFWRHLWDGFWSGGRLLSKLGWDPTGWLKPIIAYDPNHFMYGITS